MSKICGIYCIKNLVNGKVLVGSSKDITRRKYCHTKELKSNTHGNDHLQRAYNQEGKEHFDFIILEECPEEMLLQKEDEWMQKLNSLDRGFGYNLKPASRPVLHEETKLKISKANKGRPNPYKGVPKSEEMKTKIRNSKTGVPRTKPIWNKGLKGVTVSSKRGIPLSEEQKIKISLTLTGRKREAFSEEHKRNIGIAKLGKPHMSKGTYHLTDEAKQKISISNRGKKRTEEQREAIRSRMVGRKASEETRKRMSESRLKYFERREQLTSQQFYNQNFGQI